uniref:Uncharacterized protein n=1 Tax=Arundo donax TaxID=35708 RepID=A0A0A9BCD4_ARUDO
MHISAMVQKKPQGRKVPVAHGVLCRYETSSSVRLVDVHVELLNQIPEDGELAQVTGGMEGVHAEEAGVGQGDRNPVPVHVHALCDLLEAMDVAVVGSDKEARPRRPLVMVCTNTNTEAAVRWRW